MYINRTLWTVALTLLLIFCMNSIRAIGSSSGNSKVYTVKECVRQALANNRIIEVRKEKINESLYLKRQVKADFLPTFTTDYRHTRLNDVKKSTTVPSTDLNSVKNYEWMLTIKQPIFTGWALTSARELADLGIDLSLIELELEKLALVLKVKEAYFNILKAGKNVEVAEEEVASLEGHVKVAQNYWDSGLIPINDLLKSEVELSNAQHSLVKTRNVSQLTYATLNVLLSRPIDESFKVEDSLDYKPERFDLNAYITKALENRPEIKALKINIAQADQQIRLAKSKYYPEVALTYNYTKEGNDFSVSGSRVHDANSWQAVAGLTWVFWDWGKTNNSVRENLSVKKQLLQTRKTIEDNIRLELKKAILDLEETETNIPAAEKAVAQAEENLKVSQGRYKAQVTISTEVLDSQTLLSQAKTNYYNALYDHKLAKAALLKAVGEY
jgi:outer membrane protein